MDQALMERLSILKMAELLKDEIEHTINFIMNKLQEDGVTIDDETVGMFFTHLTAALNRVKNNEAITNAETTLLDEVSDSEHFEKAKSYIGMIEQESGLTLDLGEQAYIIGYICMLLEK